jgi:hypothetical protein
MNGPGTFRVRGRKRWMKLLGWLIDSLLGLGLCCLLLFSRVWVAVVAIGVLVWTRLSSTVDI